MRVSVDFVALQFVADIGQQDLRLRLAPTTKASIHGKRIRIHGTLQELESEKFSEFFQLLVPGPRPARADDLFDVDFGKPGVFDDLAVSRERIEVKPVLASD